MPKPILAQLDPRHAALAQRVTDAIAEVVDGEVLEPWEVSQVLSVVMFTFQMRLAEYLEYYIQREVERALEQHQEEEPHA